MANYKLFSARTALWTSAVLAAAVALVEPTSGRAEPQAMPAHPDLALITGAKFLPPEEYSALPKVNRFRAWLPPTVDLSDQFPVPGYQGQQQNCTAWATTYAARSYLLGRDLGRRPQASEAFSPAYVYNRLRPPGSQCTGPVYVKSALDLLRDEGVVTLSEFPDDIDKCRIPAPPTLKARAQSHRLSDWRAIDREKPSSDPKSPLILDDVKGALARRVPVVFVVSLPDDFYGAVHKADVYSTKINSGRNGHAMAAVGYDDGRQAVRVMNSWGTTWADHGYFWLSYDTFRLIASEAYALEAPVKPRANAGDSNPQQALDTEVANFQCGRVQARQVDGRLTLDGFGGIGPSMQRLKALALAASPRADFRVVYHPWPQCEAETTLAKQLGANAVQLAVVNESGQALAGEPVALRGGAKFGIRAEATAARPYLSLIYLQDDGSAIELYRGQPKPGADGHRTVEVGTGGLQTTRFEVAAPYGDEIVIALASAQPLFGSELASYATERQFLTGLRAHLLAAPVDSVAASVVRLKTSE